MSTFLQILRKKYKYSQEELAKLIGVSRQTFAQIETYNVELTVSQAQKLAGIFKLSLDDFITEKEIPESKLIITKKKTGKVANGVKKQTIRVSVPQENIRKFKEALLYILEKVGAKSNVGEGVICKLLYFIDFDYYEKYEEQLIGAAYIKNHFGPTPVGFTDLIKEMKEQNELIHITRKYFNFSQQKYLPRRKPNLTLFSAQEIQHIDWVLERLSNKNAKEMEEYTHRDVPWIITEKQSTIDYESVFYRTPEFSVREYDDELL
jgi:transcriptional regulator with XRE-family HTH domain